MTILQRLREPDPNGKPRRIKGGDWKYVIMFGLGGYVLSIGLQQYGTKLAGASLASLINCMNPIAICFFAVLLLWELACIVFDVPEILAPRPSRIIETIRGIGYVIRDKTRKE